jgi:hypothetical protein
MTVGVAVGLAAGPIQAQSNAPYQVIRMNDSTMTCEALIGEINTLSEEVRRQSADAERAARNRQTAGAVGRGLLSGLARGASMFGGGGGGGDGAMAGAVAASALAGLANEAAASGAAASAAAPTAPPPPSPQSERIAHLTSLLQSRPC